MEDRRHDGRWGKNEVPRSFSGWLSDIITAGPSLLVFSLVPFPSHFLLRESCLFLSFTSSFSRQHEPLLPFFVFRLAALSLSVPMGLRGQHGGISDQFFKPRVPRLYTSWETTLGWVPSQSETSAAAPLLGVGTSGWCRDRNEGEIKPRRKLKRGTEGSWKDRGQDAHASPSLPLATPRRVRVLFHQSHPRNIQIRVFS